MNKVFYKILAMLLLCFCSIAIANAGHGVGNGGNAVVCYKDASKTQIVSVELLDYWEMSRAYPAYGQIALGHPNLSVHEKINLFIEKVGNFDPALASKISIIANSIANNINHYLSVKTEIPDVDDDHPLVTPAAPCYIETFAIQWQDVQNGSRRFMIKSELFNHPATSNDVRAGIILHEAIYRNAILNGSKNSDGVRFYNYLMASTNGINISLKDYASIRKKTNLEMIKGCKFYNTKVGPLFALDDEGVYELCAPMTYETTKHSFYIKSGRVFFKTPDHYGFFSAKEGSAILFKNTKHEIAVESGKWNVNVDENLKIVSVSGIKNIFIQVGAKKFPCDTTYVTLTLDGRVTQCDSENESIEYQGTKIPLRTDIKTLKTDGNGVLKELSLFIGGTGTFLKIKNASKKYQLWGEVMFSPEGEVIYGSMVKPIPFKYGNKVYQVRDFTVNSLGEIEGSVRDIKFENPTFNNLPLIPSAKPMTEKFCKSVGIKVSPRATVALDNWYSQTLESYLSGSKAFYDLGQGKTVQKTDEYIKVISQIDCSGTITLNL